VCNDDDWSSDSTINGNRIIQERPARINTDVLIEESTTYYTNNQLAGQSPTANEYELYTLYGYNLPYSETM
jgi:hypothetical protein